MPSHSALRPFMNSLMKTSLSSNSRIGVGFWPITRTAESPRPMPITIRPPEMSCSVAYAAAVTAGWRVAGFVTQWPSFIVFVCSVSSVRNA